MPKMQAKTTDDSQDGAVALILDEGLMQDGPPDDIPDAVPPLSLLASVQAARVAQPAVDPSTPAGQVVMSVDEAIYRFSTQAATVLSAVEKSWDGALRVLSARQDGMQALAEALPKLTPCVPYSVSVAATSPAGYPMSFVVQAGTQEAFLANVGALMTFLRDNQFQPGAPF